MLTCFMRTGDFENYNQKIKASIFISLPFICIIYSYYLLFFVLGKSRFRKNKHLLAPFMKYIMMVGIYYLLNTPLYVLLIISSFSFEVKSGEFGGWFSFISCMMSLSSGLLLAIVRVFEGYSNALKSLCIGFFCKKKNQETKNKEVLLDDLNKENPEAKKDKDQNEPDRYADNKFIDIERKILENFSRDLFIGICHSIINSNSKKKKKDFNKLVFHEKLFKQDCLDVTEFSILKSNINFEDDEISKADHIEFDIIEYAPKIFKILRELDGLDREEVLKSLRPSMNKLSISKTQGKGGSFFITTDDNKYIMKTITSDELDLIRGIFLKKFVKHLRRFPESIICRIYGIYRMISIDGNDVNIMLMRNIIGPFKESVIAKYDLKGSSVGREEKFDIENISGVVLKDNNFIDVEHYLLMDRYETNRLRQNCISDGYFLNDMALMDYSLFLVKISLSKNEIKDIFGDEEINNYIEKNKYADIFTRRTSVNIYVNTDDSFDLQESLGDATRRQTRFNRELLNNINENILEEREEDISKSKINFEIPNTLNELGMTVNDIKSYRKFMYRSYYQNIVYLVSIIDYFQVYNFFKYLETHFKFFVSSKDKFGISCVPPHIYLERFIRYINRITDMKKAEKEGLIKLEMINY